jgi:CRP-like cAMP-binding protein
MTQNIRDIEIFAYVDESKHAKLETLFSSKSYDQGAVIIEHGKPVNGLYLLEKGKVDVSLPGFKGILATLEEGRSFGEMSLFNDDSLGSATVSVSSPIAKMLFCPRDSLANALIEDQLLAAGFYHGSARMMTERLRSTNNKISGEISKSIKMASSLINEVSSSGTLGSAQEEVVAAGTSIVSGMTEILKRLLVMKQTGETISHEDIALLADNAKDIYYSEFQVFEKVNKQLKILGQHLDNVNRILSQQDVLDVDEDTLLMDFS